MKGESDSEFHYIRGLRMRCLFQTYVQDGQTSRELVACTRNELRRSILLHDTQCRGVDRPVPRQSLTVCDVENKLGRSSLMGCCRYEQRICLRIGRPVNV